MLTLGLYSVASIVLLVCAASCPGDVYVQLLIDVYQFYDFSLTIGLEVSTVWRSQWSWSKLLYLITRYTTFMEAVVILYRKSCTFPMASIGSDQENFLQ